MKKLVALVVFSFLFSGVYAQAEYQNLGHKLPVHDTKTKLDFQIVEKEGEKFLHVKISTNLNLGCIADDDVSIIYLDNGTDVDLTPIKKYCGQLAENKKHSDYDVYYSFPAEEMELLRTHKMEYFEIEAEHQTLERKAMDFQDLSKEHFENFFVKNLVN